MAVGENLRIMLTRDPSFSYVWLFSFSLHALALLLSFEIQTIHSEQIPIHLTDGSPTSLYSRSNFANGFPSKSNPSPSDSQSDVGTKTESQEIEAFRNSLSYPELAVEQGLEDDCTFRVSVAENGRVEKLVVTAPCKYNVFDTQIKSQLREWTFFSSKGKELNLPIRFRIHERN